jgi:hypothetical protein
MRGQAVDTMVVSPAPAPPRPRTPLVRRAGFWLVVVAAGYTAAMLVLVAPHVPLGADESLYATQVSPRVPALAWTAARAPGITYLIAPILQLTGSVTALRAYLAVLSGLALTVAYRPWLRALRRPAVAPLAALLFAGLWTALLYGAEDLPNIWVAFAAVAGTGWFVRYGQRTARFAPLGVAASLAVIALMRPFDAFWVALPLFATIALVRRWRRPGLALAVAGGCLVGAADWIVDAYLRFGGIAARLHEASRQQGGLGWHPRGLLYQLRALNGPLLCRPCSLHHLTAPPAWLLRAWWLAIPLLVAAALIVARRQGRLAVLAPPAAVATSIGLAYLVTVDYAAPRFLLPAYALAALPIASLLATLAAPPRARSSGRPQATLPASLHARPARSGLATLPAALRAVAPASPHGPRPASLRAALAARHRGRAVVAALILLLALHQTAQLASLRRIVHRPDPTAAAAAQLRRLGVRRPCVLAGPRRTQLAYRLGCTTSAPAGLPALARRRQAVLLTWHRNDHRAGPGWRRHPMPRPHGIAPWYAFVAPAPASRPPGTDARHPA